MYYLIVYFMQLDINRRIKMVVGICCCYCCCYGYDFGNLTFQQKDLCISIQKKKTIMALYKFNYVGFCGA